MAKTRRKKINKSPTKPYRNARAFIVEKGETIMTAGVRGKTHVKRVVNEDGKRLTSARITEDVPQIAAKMVGDVKPKAIFVGRQYTGVPRSKAYPYRSKKRGAPEAPAPKGLLGGLTRAAKRVKQVIVGDTA